jgi:hypothetical protein
VVAETRLPADESDIPSEARRRDEHRSGNAKVKGATANVMGGVRATGYGADARDLEEEKPKRGATSGEAKPRTRSNASLRRARPRSPDGRAWQPGNR